MRGGFGLIGNLVVGVIRALVDGFLFGLFGLKSVGFIGALGPPRSAPSSCWPSSER